MAHSENSHNHDDHGHDMTEGKRQYYPKGWYIPLAGLVLVALIFSLGAGSLLGVSGTDKWGKKDECCTAEGCKDGDHHECEGKEDHHDGGHHEGNHESNTMMSEDKDKTHMDDSAAVVKAPAADSGAAETPKEGEPVH